MQTINVSVYDINLLHTMHICAHAYTLQKQSVCVEYILGRVQAATSHFVFTKVDKQFEINVANPELSYKVHVQTYLHNLMIIIDNYLCSVIIIKN